GCHGCCGDDGVGDGDEGGVPTVEMVTGETVMMALAVGGDDSVEEINVVVRRLLLATLWLCGDDGGNKVMRRWCEGGDGASMMMKVMVSMGLWLRGW
ncbi:hypothetical protein Tco_0341766, partial [Tanacetum coccineum]